ncbi:MAG: flagellar assembly protein FliW [Nitrospinae bacterium]|nr:flagellar assembly protein FliW [Nitrospinota bacterium]
MILESTRLGQVKIKESDVFHFPEGLYGFENERRFVLLPLNPNVDCPLEYMHSLSNPDLAFVVTDPYTYIPDYKLHLTEDDRRQILLEYNQSTLVRVIVRVPQNYLEMTANLVAPVVFNMEKRIGRQFVLTSPEYDTRHFLIPKELRSAGAKI